MIVCSLLLQSAPIVASPPNPPSRLGQAPQVSIAPPVGMATVPALGGPVGAAIPPPGMVTPLVPPVGTVSTPQLSANTITATGVARPPPPPGGS